MNTHKYTKANAVFKTTTTRKSHTKLLSAPRECDDAKIISSLQLIFSLVFVIFIVCQCLFWMCAYRHDVRSYGGGCTFSNTQFWYFFLVNSVWFGRLLDFVFSVMFALDFAYCVYGAVYGAVLISLPSKCREQTINQSRNLNEFNIFYHDDDDDWGCLACKQIIHKYNGNAK